VVVVTVFFTGGGGAVMGIGGAIAWGGAVVATPPAQPFRWVEVPAHPLPLGARAATANLGPWLARPEQLLPWTAEAASRTGAVTTAAAIWAGQFGQTCSGLADTRAIN
jgi:hypothetical protein